MADPEGRLLRIGDWGLDIQVPNPALQAWLNSDECRVALEKIAQEIFRTYKNSLPRSRMNPKIPGSGMKNLRRGAYAQVGRATYPGQTERFYAWVGNRALSYKPAVGKPYPRFIEYGKKNADGSRTGGAYHLRNAMLAVAKNRGAYAAAAAYVGVGDANPDLGQARPALPKSEIEKLRELASGGAAARERSERNRRREAANRARGNLSRQNLARAAEKARLEQAKRAQRPKPTQK